MYIPKPNEETRVDTLHAVMRAAPFVTLVTPGKSGPEVNHLPLVLHADEGPHGTLRGHVARANPVWRDLLEMSQAGENAAQGSPTQESRAGIGKAAAGVEACIAVFNGGDHYISPSWYPSKRQDPRTVPTWNYVVVHAHGTITVQDDGEWLRAHLEVLTDRHEGGRADRWRVSDAPEEFLGKLRGAIVGIEFAITRLEGKVKASQNRTAEDRAGVIQGLLAEGTEAAASMARWVPAGE